MHYICFSRLKITHVNTGCVYVCVMCVRIADGENIDRLVYSDENIDRYRIWQNFHGFHNFAFNREYFPMNLSYSISFAQGERLGIIQLWKFSREWSFVYFIPTTKVFPLKSFAVYSSI